MLMLGSGVGLMLGSVFDASAQEVDVPPPVSVPSELRDLDVVRALQERNRALEAQVQTLTVGSGAIQAQLEQVEARLTELRQLQGELDAGCTVDAQAAEQQADAEAEAERQERELEEARESARQERVAQLSQTINAMNRRSAAQLITELDRDLAAQVVQQLSSRDAGRLLGELPADVAAELTIVLVNVEDDQ